MPQSPQAELEKMPAASVASAPMFSCSQSWLEVYWCHSLATAAAPLSGSARFVVMSRLQEMQHYICLQPTGTRTRSCYVIKEGYPERERERECVCVAQHPPGFGNY